MDVQRTVDAVIVGGGPAGALAAREFARHGVETLVVDRRQEIGAPKRCAEGISAEALRRVGVTPHPAWASGTVSGVVLHTPSGREVVVDHPAAAGYVVERKVFEKHLAKDAIESGARYMVKTHVDNVLRNEDGYAVGITGDFMGRPVRIDAKIVVGADGVDSLIGRKAGLRGSLQKMCDFHSAAQYEMAGVQCDMTRLHVFVGAEVAKLGYAWIFPKAGGLANVGVGIATTESRPQNRAMDFLERFVADRPRLFGNASALEINASGIPVSGGLRKFWGNGIMLVGDAAQQVNPVHGGGIGLAMRAGALAGQVGAQAIKEGDVSDERLEEYGRRWQEGDGRELLWLRDFRNYLENVTDEDIENIAEAFPGNSIVGLVQLLGVNSGW